MFDVDEVEEAFSNMKRAAGVGDMAEVVDRFATQKKTANILKLQNEKSKKEVTPGAQALETPCAPGAGVDRPQGAAAD